MLRRAALRGEGGRLGGDPFITLRYASALEARRDRLPDVARGVIARTRPGVREGDALPVRIELAREKLTLEVRARVRWATPLATGTLAGLELEGPSRREEVQLDLLLGIRSASQLQVLPRTTVEHRAIPALPKLSVALLEAGRVLREVLALNLVRFAREGNRWDLDVEALATADAFLAAMSARRRNLAVVDCDGIDADPLVHAIRSRAEWARLPLVLLSRTPSARPDDRYALTVRKPVSMKALVDRTAVLLRSGE